MPLPEDDAEADGRLRTGVLLACAASLGALALTERFTDLPGAAAALVSTWFLLRPRPASHR